MAIDENLARLMKQLGAAINESLSESETVSDALNEIRESGYDIFLILEATIGFHKRPEISLASGADEQSPPKALPAGELLLNAQDAQFLKSLRIKLAGTEEK